MKRRMISEMRRINVLLIVMGGMLLLSACSDNSQNSSFADYGSGQNEKYTYITYGDKTYLPFSAVDSSDMGEQIGTVNGDKKDKIYEFRGFSSDEWIIELYESGEMDGAMLLREENVTDFPEGMESEYEWNQFATVESCTSERPEQEVSDSTIGLTMYAKNITSTGCTLVFEQSGGVVTGELQTGQWFELQVKNGDGDWIDDSARDTEMAWEDIAYSIKSEGTTELQVSWKDIYGDRTSGHYRIVKKVNDFRGTGDYDTYEVCAEFAIK